MAPLPTESRIFAAQYMRDLRSREAALSNKISPGTSAWHHAVEEFWQSVVNTGSTVKRAHMIHSMTDFLNESVGDGAHFILDCGGTRRSAGLMFATLTAGENPFLGVHEQGVSITKHMIMARRTGAVGVLPDVGIAYISEHAIGRLHERGHDLNNGKATCVLACIGILGLITRESVKHIDGGLCMHYDNTLVCGSLKHARKPLRNGKDTNGTIYEVRTALQSETVTNQEMLDQGAWATHAVAKWLDDRTINYDVNNKLAETIPFIPRREDYTSLHAIEDLTRSKP